MIDHDSIKLYSIQLMNVRKAIDEIEEVERMITLAESEMKKEIGGYEYSLNNSIVMIISILYSF